jgi:Holliday junction DNA helicase RuvA
MISSIEGKLIHKANNHAVVELNGICLDVEISENTYNKLPKLNERVKLFTQLIIKDDKLLSLYGFMELEEKELFLKLLSIRGISCKLAMNILSNISPAEFKRAIQEEDISKITKAVRVGKKSAQRLILELKGKLIPIDRSVESKKEKEVISALVRLGYKKKDAESAIKKIKNAEELSIEELLKESLKELQNN